MPNQMQSEASSLCVSVIHSPTTIMILIFPKEKAKRKGRRMFDWTPADWDIGASFFFFFFFFCPSVGFGTRPDLFLLPNAYQLHTPPPFFCLRNS